MTGLLLPLLLLLMLLLTGTGVAGSLLTGTGTDWYLGWYDWYRLYWLVLVLAV